MNLLLVRCFGLGAIALFTPLVPLNALAIYSAAVIAQADPTARMAEGDRLFQQGKSQFQNNRLDEALQSWQQALEIYQSSDIRTAFPTEGRQRQGAILNELGSAYASRQQYQFAIESYHQGLEISQETGNLQGELESLRGLGLVYLNLGQYPAAANFLERSAAIEAQLSSQSGVPNVSNIVEPSIDAFQAATEEGYNDACFAQSDETANQIAQTYRSAGADKYNLMIDQYERYVEIIRGQGDRLGEGQALTQIGAIHYSFSQFSLAADAFLRAIDLYESIRTGNLSAINQVSFFDTYSIAYFHLQQTFIANSEVEQALVISEASKARSLVSLLSSPPAKNEPRSAAVSSSIPEFTLADIRRVAKEQNTTLVQYSLINFNSLDHPLVYIWVIKPTGEVSFQSVNLSNVDLLKLVCETRESIGGNRQDRGSITIEPTPRAMARQQDQQRQQLRKLHQLLVEPISRHLPTDPSQKVVFIPHNELFLIPFPALIDADGQYLIENHTLLTAPSIRVLDLTQQKQRALAGNASRQVGTSSPLIVGDPTMPRVANRRTGQLEPLSSLAGARAEANAIATKLNAEALVANRATKVDVVRRMPSARLIHLATHGLLEYGTPENTGVLDVPGAIALAPGGSDNGLLTAAEILQMDLSADLVVLSACDTGRGRITGDGVVGLSRAFVAAGVPSIIVSLWAVDDAATADLMVAFYDHWQQSGDKAQALRQAMLTTMAQHPDPRLWAAFTLIGSAQ